jgi:hypothetical protein
VKVKSVRLRLEDISEGGRSMALDTKDRTRVDVVMIFAPVRLRVRQPGAAPLRNILGQMAVGNVSRPMFANLNTKPSPAASAAVPADTALPSLTKLKLAE